MRLILDDILLHAREEEVDIICFRNSTASGDARSGFSVRRYPYRSEPDRGDGKLLLAVFSKYPITDWQIIPFENSCNDGLWCDLSIDGRPVRIVNVHMQTTSITQSRALIEGIKENYVIGDLHGVNQLQNTIQSNFVKRAEQARQVHAIVQSTRSPLILCGDFNDTPVSYTYQTIRGDLLKDGFKKLRKRVRIYVPRLFLTCCASTSSYTSGESIRSATIRCRRNGATTIPFSWDLRSPNSAAARVRSFETDLNSNRHSAEETLSAPFPASVCSGKTHVRFT